MKQFFIKKTVTAVLFICILFTLSFLNWAKAYPALGQNLSDFLDGTASSQTETFPTFVKAVNDTTSEDVFGKYNYVEGYGYIQKLLNKDEINNFEVVKAKDGSLNYTYFTTGPNSVTTIADRMGRLQNACTKKGSQLIYLMTPDKYIIGSTKFETGLPYNYANETADHFLGALQSRKIATVDFRTLMKKDGVYKADSFYRTDHHWKVQTAFWAYTKLVGVLENEYGEKFKNDDTYENLDNYNQILYKNAYLGSMGRKEGMLYSGTEDFTFIFPKFNTDFFLYAQDSGKEITRKGTFQQSICFTSLLSQDNIYDTTSDKYFTYMDGNPGYVEINNNNNRHGIKVLFIKDSLIVPVASFFALDCSKVTMVDPRYYSGNIEDVVKKSDFDYIFVSYSPQNLTTEFFPFYKNK